MSRERRKSVYALVAELTVIVVGVLIALTADSLWQERGERERELQYVVALREDVDEGQRVVDAAIDSMSLYIDITDAQIEVMRSQRPMEDAARTGLFFWHVPIPTGTLEALVATGDLHLLRDPTVRAVVLRERAILQDAALGFRDYQSMLVTNLATHMLLTANATGPEGYSFRRIVDESEVNPEVIMTFEVHRIGLDTQRYYLQQMASALANLSTTIPSPH